MEKRKRIWASEKEREAWESHVDETLDRLWALAEGAQAQLDSREPRARPRTLRDREAHVDETLARLRRLAEKAQAEVDAKKRAEAASEPSA